MNDRAGNTGKQSKGYKALFGIGGPVIFESEVGSLENLSGVDEIGAVSLQIEGALAF